MKRIALCLLLLIGCYGAQAQHYQDFEKDFALSSHEMVEDGTVGRGDGGSPHDPGGETPSPIGSGLLILTGLSAGYALLRNRKEDKSE